MARAAFPPDLKFKTMRDQAVAIFHAFDHNNDGTVSEEELGTVMKQLDPTWTDDAVAALVKSVDTSQDGRLQFGEFFDWMFCEEIKRDDDSRRKLLGSSGEVAESVLVEVFDNGGDRVFGPEELPGSKTGVDLKELITLQTGVPAGTLCSGGRFLLGSASLGSCGTAELTLTMGRDVLTDLTEKCRNQLRGLGAMGYGDQCIRVGKGEHTRTSHSGPKSGSGDGDDDSEFMLTPDGRVLAKEHHYFGYKDHTGENVRAWRYQIAEGTFTIVDAETCKAAGSTSDDGTCSCCSSPRVASLVISGISDASTTTGRHSSQDASYAGATVAPPMLTMLNAARRHAGVHAVGRNLGSGEVSESDASDADESSPDIEAAARRIGVCVGRYALAGKLPVRPRS